MQSNDFKSETQLTTIHPA